ncbi:PTS system protein [Salmonella enterica subsp. enterica]|uniref:PTS system protein n=1 Tax=Salmonella enterica I TaxID=59201 RepID=A0A379WIJ8_SALET|nr:PTS system protein [Salmonella enterica subsp. enterica]
MTTTQPLPHILLLTHGGWGQPLCNSLRMVTGEIKGVTEIALMLSIRWASFINASRPW